MIWFSFCNNFKTSSCLLKLVVIKADLYYEITLDLQCCVYKPIRKRRRDGFLSQKFLEPSLTLSTHSLLTLAHEKTHWPSIASPTCFVVFQRNYCKSDLPFRFAKLFFFYCVMQYFLEICFWSWLILMFSLFLFDMEKHYCQAFWVA